MDEAEREEVSAIANVDETCVADLRFSQYVHPLAPTIANITTHYNQRSSATILHLREDTMSQLINLANIRPGGRYLVVDDTGGLVTAALLDRMACEGKIITFTDSDSPPAWGVLDTMNFSAQQLECVKALSWMEADEDYVKRQCSRAVPADTQLTSSSTARRNRHADGICFQDASEAAETHGPGVSSRSDTE